MAEAQNEVKKVVLDVGGRRFTTTKDTLGHSTFFLALLSGRLEHSRQADGSYFIDADPERFVDILAFLRRGTMPLYWDAGRGHDYARYHALLEEARFFGLPELENWLASQAYHKAVAYQTQVVTKDVKSLETFFLDAARPDVHVRWVDDNTYYCCAGVRRHHGHPEFCDQSCFKHREDVGIPCEKGQKAQVVVVSTKVQISAPEFRTPQQVAHPPPYQAT
ncbi:hypothetical protein F4779DRAFT_382995 [Xylariaceae sp. FL0662B]|nr:hypothetical protein F4779DRAFT_382995 [Xylariaceae sp. FL0662B]